MADECWRKSNIVFGSAGMAAAGMLPEAVEKPKPKPLPPEPLREPEPPRLLAEEPTVTEVDAEVPVVELPEDDEMVLIEELIPDVEPALPGYGINSKAQGLYADLTAVVIGDGGRVVNGYNWDHALAEIPGIVVSGISDPNGPYLTEMEGIYRSDRGYRDYRELLARSKPNLAIIPQVGSAKRYEIIKYCLMIGAHVICPAPFTRSLAEADELMALAGRRGLKVAVAHPLRLDPNVLRLQREMGDLIGDLVEIRVLGEMGRNAGGEDLLRHGVPLFDLVRMFAGDAVWCHGTIFSNGSRVAREHIRMDGLYGPVVGDAVYGHFYTEKGIMVNFVSNQKLCEVSGGWGMEFLGSRGIIRLFGGDQPVISILKNPGARDPRGVDKWGLWPELRDPYFVEVDGLTGADAANRLVIGDWLEAITQDREPENSARRAGQALEMAHAIFQSAMTGGSKVYFPMPNRHHPLIPELRTHDATMKESA